jgi:hypothetical protein
VQAFVGAYMTLSEKAYMIRELWRCLWRGRFRLLYEEFLWNELLRGCYQGARRDLVLTHLVSECALAANWGGGRGRRCAHVLEMALQRFEQTIPFAEFDSAQRANLLRWSGIAQFPSVRQRLGGS